MTFDDSTRDTVRVPKVKSAEGVVEWMEVDAEWHEHCQVAESAKEQVAQEYGDHPRVISVGLTAVEDEPRLGEHRRFAVSIELLDDGDAPLPEFPNKLDGISVQVSTGQPGTPLSDDPNQQDTERDQ